MQLPFYFCFSRKKRSSLAACHQWKQGSISQSETVKLESASLILDAMIATLLGRIDSLSGENASMFHCESVVWSRILYIARLYCRDDKHQFKEGKED